MIDLDSLQWWGNIAHKFITSLGVGWLTIDRLWERFKPIEEFVDKRWHERRKDMSILGEVEALIALVPKLEKAVSDAKALEGSPQGAALIADVEGIISEVKAAVPSAGTNDIAAPLGQEPPKAA